MTGLHTQSIASAVAANVHDVIKTFATHGTKTTVLHDVSLSAPAGKFTAIVGPSGSGKTTLLRIIGGLSKPNSGSVEVFDKSLYTQRDKHISSYRNATIGFVFQDYRLIEHYNAIENVMVPLKIAGLTIHEQKQRAKEVLTLVGLSGFESKPVTKLSGGQQQRVAIARALAMHPRLLIADEPTGNLDSTTGAQVLQLFSNLLKQGITIIMVTHDESIADRADHIVRLHDGRVVGVGDA